MKAPGVSQKKCDRLPVQRTYSRSSQDQSLDHLKVYTFHVTDITITKQNKLTPTCKYFRFTSIRPFRHAQWRGVFFSAFEALTSCINHRYYWQQNIESKLLQVTQWKSAENCLEWTFTYLISMFSVSSHSRNLQVSFQKFDVSTEKTLFRANFKPLV